MTESTAPLRESGRRVQVVLCTADRVLGALPPFAVDVPWWPEVSDIVATVRRRYGLDVTVLRLIGWPTDRRAGGAVSYLAEVDRPVRVPLTPWLTDPLEQQPHRQPWAIPGGPSALLSWATDRLACHGLSLTGRAEQIKTWNLSALWRLPTSAGPVWLKCVPHFFAHEGALIDTIGSRSVPTLLGYAPGRVLMADIEGDDNYATTGDALRPMIELLTGEQARWLGRTDELLELGLPNRRFRAIQPRIEQVAEATRDQLDAADQAALDTLIEGLPERISALDACGLPDTLVHGDFHPGNVRGSAPRYVILDWGDSAVGHPLTDELAFTRPLGPADRAAAADGFCRAWQGLVPGCDPRLAIVLLRPLSALVTAVQYADFLDNIEPDERIYHHVDVALMLQQAIADAVG